MTVNRDDEGRRSVQAEVEVPGTPEEVWRMIATGPGVSSWFVPAAIDGRAGGQITMDFGPAMESHATITAWDPPHRYTAEGRDDMGPEGPTLATEWIVEARDGGTCLVRVVHSWFADGDDWDAYFEEVESGWPTFFRILRLYLTHFRGLHGVAPMQLVGVAPEPKEDAWEALIRPLGLAGATVGERLSTSGDLPPLAGTVAWAGEPKWPAELLIQLDAPAPGIAHLFAMAMGGQVFIYVRCYLYGSDAAPAVARIEPAWRSWLAERFPVPAAPAAD
jgi:uncharacterized protein YndB with AHSA1/START domain